jgi:hypothetical protein
MFSTLIFPDCVPSTHLLRHPLPQSPASSLVSYPDDFSIGQVSHLSGTVSGRDSRLCAFFHRELSFSCPRVAVSLILVLFPITIVFFSPFVFICLVFLSFLFCIVLDEEAKKLKKGKGNQKMLEAAQRAQKKKKVVGRKERKKEKKKIGPLLAHSPISCLW